jgi:hypothetical protein
MSSCATVASTAALRVWHVRRSAVAVSCADAAASVSSLCMSEQLSLTMASSASGRREQSSSGGAMAAGIWCQLCLCMAAVVTLVTS